jgi:hypothetical protein
VRSSFPQLKRENGTSKRKKTKRKREKANANTPSEESQGLTIFWVDNPKKNRDWKEKTASYRSLILKNLLLTGKKTTCGIFKDQILLQHNQELA